MTTEMQEIAITEEKPLLTGQADAAKVRDAAAHTRIMHVNVHTHAHHGCELAKHIHIYVNTCTHKGTQKCA